MNKRGMAKWAAVGYVATLGAFIVMQVIRKMDGVSSGDVIANFATFMITQFYPLFAIIPPVLAYAVFSKRWYAFLGACVGNIAFFPATLVLGGTFSLVVGSPISAWQEGWHIAALASSILYCVLAFLLIRRRLRQKRSQQSGGDVRS